MYPTLYFRDALCVALTVLLQLLVASLLDQVPHDLMTDLYIHTEQVKINSF